MTAFNVQIYIIYVDCIFRSNVFQFYSNIRKSYSVDVNTYVVGFRIYINKCMEDGERMSSYYFLLLLLQDIYKTEFKYLHTNYLYLPYSYSMYRAQIYSIHNLYYNFIAHLCVIHKLNK